MENIALTHGYGPHGDGFVAMITTWLGISYQSTRSFERRENALAFGLEVVGKVPPQDEWELVDTARLREACILAENKGRSPQEEQRLEELCDELGFDVPWLESFVAEYPNG